jgi:hypothetical protein
MSVTTDQVISFGASIYNLITWRYLPILVLILTPITVYYLARNYVWVYEELLDEETGKKEKSRVFRRKTAILLSSMAVAAPLLLYFAYLFFKVVGI